MFVLSALGYTIFYIIGTDKETQQTSTYTSSDWKKSTLSFFALKAPQFWEMTLVFHYYLGKLGLYIFPDLKRKQIKY